MQLKVNDLSSFGILEKRFQKLQFIELQSELI